MASSGDLSLFRRQKPAEGSSATGSRSSSVASSDESTLTGRRARERSSISRLREDGGRGRAGIPEAVQEVRESLLLEPAVQSDSAVSGHTAPFTTPAVVCSTSDTSSHLGRRSGSATLAERRDSERLDDKASTPSPLEQTAEISLDQDTKGIVLPPPVLPPPVLVLEAPTPPVAGDVLSKRAALPPSRLGAHETLVALPDHTTPGLANNDEVLSDPVSSHEVSPFHHPSEAAISTPVSSELDTNAGVPNTAIEAPLKSDRLQGHVYHDSNSSALPTSAIIDYFTAGLPNMTAMLQRKIWVRRPGASATLVQIREDDLVDDVRDMILRKYANSLGRTFDPPDMTLRIQQRVEAGQQQYERVLGPEEDMCRTIDHYYPGGQQVHEALTIDVPQKRTPKPSPRIYQQNASYHALDELRPLENGNDYFPPMPAANAPPMQLQAAGSHDSRTTHHFQTPHISTLNEHQRSMSVLNTGQVPLLPSPGGSRRHRNDLRPKFNRQQTASPTLAAHTSHSLPATNMLSQLNPATHMVHRNSTRPRLDSTASELPPAGFNSNAPVPPPLPTPPAPDATAVGRVSSTPTTPSGSATLAPGSHRGVSRAKKTRRTTPDGPSVSRPRNLNGAKPDSQRRKDSPPAHLSTSVSAMLDASVPPINVLIVEDNIINLRILEGLMKRLKVRWQTAMNGQIAVDKWKKGGFHLMLMDIQMPVMNGLQATREVRRLEREGGVGVFSEGQRVGQVNGGSGTNGAAEGKEGGIRPGNGLFKSPVIIVALTASSLQSDRHEALAAGCNDFLTKPVNFVWLERKVKEWGCMQALIDFDGWRRWKDYAEKEESGKTDEEKKAEAEKAEKQRVKMEKFAKLQEKQKETRQKADEERRRLKSVTEGGSNGISAAVAEEDEG